MRKFLIRGTIFMTPLLFIFLAVFIIDPYYLFHKNRPFDQGLYDIDYSFDQGRRYKIITYLNNPDPFIILGASEINLIHERNIPETGWHSLSFGGAPLQETLDLFWFLTESHEISKIIFAPEFIKFYNACIGEFYSWNTSQSCKAIDLFENKLDYLCDKYVIRSSFYVMTSHFGVMNDKNKPQMTKEEFWGQQLSYGESQFSQTVSGFSFHNTLNKIQEMADYCQEHNIEVSVVIPAQHDDLIKVEYGEVAYPVYREYLSNLVNMFGKVYFFDYPNQMTENAELFSDPFHFTVDSLYLEALWKDNRTNCIILESESDLRTLDIIRNTKYMYE